MKMFVFYFTAFFVDPNGRLPIPITNSFVYHTPNQARSQTLWPLLVTNHMHEILCHTKIYMWVNVDDVLWR